MHNKIHTYRCAYNLFRFFNGEQFEEELLSLIELDGDTKGLTVYNSLSRKLDDLGLPL